MKIKKLSIKNFKGIKNLVIESNGEDVNIFGENATGKTTIFDAFIWLMFDKDSLNKSNFNIKPLKENGEAIHGLESEVEVIVLIDAKELTLKKVFKEKWVKTRGRAVETFSGHTTDYFVNGVPSKKKEYVDEIAEITDEAMFKLLTSPLYFNEQLHWTDRRKTLLEVCGNLSDEDVINSEPKLKKLSGILGERDIEDHKKIIAVKRKKINEQLEKIPVRIDEVVNSKPDITGIDLSKIENQIEELRLTQDSHRKSMADIKNGSQISKKEKRLAELDAELLELKISHNVEKEDALKELIEKRNNLQDDLSNINRELKSKEYGISICKSRIDELESTIKTLREKWHKVNDKEFEFSQEEVCPTCGQTIPESQLQEARSKALAAYNFEKSKELEGITEKGKNLASELSLKKEEFTELEKSVAELNNDNKIISSKLDSVQVEIDKVCAGFEDYIEKVEYKSRVAEKSKINSEIGKLCEGDREEIEKYRKAISEIDIEIKELQTKFSKKEQVQKADARIEELKADKKELAKQFEELEEELFLTEEFIKKKVNLFEERINSRFKYARFKLFKQNINGGIEACCESTYLGVPYSDMNNAARTNIGLDIINTLSEYFGFTAPIFIDNRESIVRMTEMKAQVSSLFVSKNDKGLRIEIPEYGKRVAV